MLPAAQPLLPVHQARGSVPWLTPWFRSSRPGGSGTCPQCTRTRRRSTSAPRCTLRPSVRTGIPNRSEHSIPSLMICIGWPTGSNSAGSRRSSWNPPGSTGFRSTRSWNSAGSRCRWSMPGMPGTFPGARPTSVTHNGYSVFMSAAEQLPAAGRDRDLAGLSASARAPAG